MKFREDNKIVKYSKHYAHLSMSYGRAIADNWMTTNIPQQLRRQILAMGNAIIKKKEDG